MKLLWLKAIAATVVKWLKAIAAAVVKWLEAIAAAVVKVTVWCLVMNNS